MNALEQAKAKQEKVQREIRQLENRQKILLNKQADAERRARIRRLIEHGAILESIFPALTSLSGEEVKAFLLPLSRLPGVPKLPQEKPPNPLSAPLSKTTLWTKGCALILPFTIRGTGTPTPTSC